jgi:hypothetical protein
MKFNKSINSLAIIILVVGNVFYLVSLFFKSFAIELIMIFSNEITPAQLNTAGESVLLFFTGMLGAMLYLIGFLLIALSREGRSAQLKFVYYGLFLWFITDSLISFIHGFVWNIAFNMVFLVTGVVLLRLIDDTD